MRIDLGAFTCASRFGGRDVGWDSDSAIDAEIDTALWIDSFRIDLSATMDLLAFIFAMVCISNFMTWYIRYRRAKRLDDDRIRKIFA